MSERTFRVSTGSVFDDIADVATSVTDRAGDALSSAWDVVDGVPGFKQLGEGTKAIFTGPLRDFAKTTVGQVVIRALSSTLMGASAGLAGLTFVGPALALSANTVALSMPGLVRGESFWKAYFNEGIWRVKETAKIAGGEVANKLLDSAKEELGSALKSVQGVLDKSFNSIEMLSVNAALSTGTPLSKFLTPEALAMKLGIPSLSVDDLAKKFGIQVINAAILQHYLYPEKWPYFPSPSSFDPITGKQKPGIALGRRPVSSTPSTQTPCESYDIAVKNKFPQATLDVLKKKCEAYQKEQANKAIFSSSAFKAIANFGKKPDVNATLANLQTFSPAEVETTSTRKWLFIGSAVLGLGAIGGLILWRRKR